MLLDTVSTSDADERELFEAANSTSYWERVIASSHPVLSVPQVRDMEGVMPDSDPLVRALDVIYAITGQGVHLRSIEDLQPRDTLLLSYILPRMPRCPPKRLMNLSAEQSRKFLQHQAGPIADHLHRLLPPRSLLPSLLPHRYFTTPKHRGGIPKRTILYHQMILCSSFLLRRGIILFVLMLMTTTLFLPTLLRSYARLLAPCD